MLQSCQNNNKIMHLHERCMWLIHNNKFLENDGSVSIHHRNIATDIFQIKLSQSPESLTDIVIWTTQQYKKIRILESWFCKHLQCKPQNLGNCSIKNETIQFSEQIKKRNQKMGTTTKLSLEALQLWISAFSNFLSLESLSWF